jgi:hypothetical protein
MPGRQQGVTSLKTFNWTEETEQSLTKAVRKKLLVTTKLYLIFFFFFKLGLGFKLRAFQSRCSAERQWLTPVILATQEAKIRRIEVQSQPG